MRRTFSARAIADFCDTWPCSGLRAMRKVTFEYDSGGNLVDIETIPAVDPETGEPFDGAAMVALSNDAQCDRVWWRRCRGLPIRPEDYR